MASPYDFKYVVPEGYAPIKYRGTTYCPGDTISVKFADKICFFKMFMSDAVDGCPFPEFGLTSDGYPTDGYRVPVLIPAGETIIHTVPVPEGCMPGQVHFNYCADCIYVGYNSDPLIDPDDPNAASGGGADPNPTVRDLVRNGLVVETIHIHNPSTSSVLVMLSYYC